MQVKRRKRGARKKLKFKCRKAMKAFKKHLAGSYQTTDLSDVTVEDLVEFASSLGIECSQDGTGYSCTKDGADSKFSVLITVTYQLLETQTVEDTTITETEVVDYFRVSLRELRPSSR